MFIYFLECLQYLWVLVQDLIRKCMSHLQSICELTSRKGKGGEMEKVREAAKESG